MRTLQCHAGPILVRIGVGVALTLSVALTQVLTLSLAQVPVPGEQVWGVGVCEGEREGGRVRCVRANQLFIT